MGEEGRCRPEAIGAVDILPLKPGEELGIKVQKHIGKQTAYVILLISVLLVIIGLGIKSAADGLPNMDLDLYYVGHALHNIAWLVGLLGVAGFFVAGLALLLSYPTPPTPKKEKTNGEEKEKGLVAVPKPPN